MKNNVCISWWKNAIDSIRLNRVVMGTGPGRSMVLKRRNAFGARIIPLANLFFRALGVPITFWRTTSLWRQHEVQTFKMLNPQFHAEALGDAAVIEEKLPGESLWIHLKRGTLTRRMVRAAAREFRRAHAVHSDVYRGPWSHGDAAMCNVLYDPETDRARFIDFELSHNPHLTTDERHADDLLAFLLDLVSMCPEYRWLPYVRAFLEVYDSPAISEALCRRLVIPRGRSWFWWKIRSNFADSRMIQRRLTELRQFIQCEPAPAPSQAHPHPRFLPDIYPQPMRALPAIPATPA